MHLHPFTSLHFPTSISCTTTFTQSIIIIFTVSRIIVFCILSFNLFLKVTFQYYNFVKSYSLLNQLYKQTCKKTNVSHIIKFMLIEGECSRCQCQTDSLFHWLLIILSHLSFIFGPWVTQFFAFTKDFNCLFFLPGGWWQEKRHFSIKIIKVLKMLLYKMNLLFS